MGITDVIRRGIKGLTGSPSTPAGTDRAPVPAEQPAGRGSDAVTKMVETLLDVGLDGKLAFASAESVAWRASRGVDTETAIDRIISSHQRTVTVAGFITGLGGLPSLPIALPVNVVEFYLHAIRTVGAIASVRGYDLHDDEVRARVLVSLLGEESGDWLDHVGLGPLSGVAARTVAKRLPRTEMSQVANAIGVRILRRAGQRSFRLFGKAIPGLGGIIGAYTDRKQLTRIAAAARRDFPAVRELPPGVS